MHISTDGIGNSMSNEWREVSLGDVVTLQRGFDLPETEREPGPYPVIASTGPVGTHHTAAVKGPGVVIGRSGSLGGGQFIKSDFWPLNTTLWVKDFHENDQRFCYYLLKSLNLADFNAGSGVPTLNRNHIHPLPVKVPGVVEQRAIAHILGTLDDKIELNHRMNETLEAMAKVFFESWFVDFAPVRAKMDGHWRRGESMPGLPKEHYGLFPDRLVDSDLGEIPEGWEVKALGDLAKVIYGAAFASKHFNDTGKGLPLIRIRDLATHAPRVFTNEQHPKGHLIRPGDIVVGMDGEFRAHIWKGPVSWLNQRVCCFQPHQGVPSQYLIKSLTGPLANFERSKVGTTVIHLSKTDIESIQLACPPTEVFDAFAFWTDPIVQQIVECAATSRFLTAQRDALLPKLLSGKITVGNWIQTPNGEAL